MTVDLSDTTLRLIAAIEAGEVFAARGYLVGLDRPALLAPDPAATLAAGRPDEVLAWGHRWRIVTQSLWIDLLALGRERPEQEVYVVDIEAIATLDSAGLSDLEQDGWRGNRGTVFILPITWDQIEHSGGAGAPGSHTS